MNTIESTMAVNRHNERCAEAIRTLELFIANAEMQHETKIPLSTLKLVINTVAEVDDVNNL